MVSQPCCLTLIAGNARSACISMFLTPVKSRPYGAVDLTRASPVITLPCMLSMIALTDSFAFCAKVCLCHAVCKSWHMAHAWREVGVKHPSSCCIPHTACACHDQAGMFWHDTSVLLPCVTLVHEANVCHGDMMSLPGGCTRWSRPRSLSNAMPCADLSAYPGSALCLLLLPVWNRYGHPSAFMLCALCAAPGVTGPCMPPQSQSSLLQTYSC